MRDVVGTEFFPGGNRMVGKLRWSEHQRRDVGICQPVVNGAAIGRDRQSIYLAALSNPQALYSCIADTVRKHHQQHGVAADAAVKILQLDAALCPRSGEEARLTAQFDFDAAKADQALSAMELPADILQGDVSVSVSIHHPGGLGDLLQVADGGSWMRGVIMQEETTRLPDTQYVAIA